jgi:hypothetical protein
MFSSGLLNYNISLGLGVYKAAAQPAPNSFSSCYISFSFGRIIHQLTLPHFPIFSPVTNVPDSTFLHRLMCPFELLSTCA